MRYVQSLVIINAISLFESQFILSLIGIIKENFQKENKQNVNKSTNNNNIFFENSNSSLQISLKTDNNNSIINEHINERKRSSSSPSDINNLIKVKKEKLNLEIESSKNTDLRQKRKNYHPFSIFALAELNNEKTP